MRTDPRQRLDRTRGANLLLVRKRVRRSRPDPRNSEIKNRLLHPRTRRIRTRKKHHRSKEEVIQSLMSPVRVSGLVFFAADVLRAPD
jgi:hypothetical protein